MGSNTITQRGDFMTTLKNNKLLQIFIGISSSVLLLIGCYLLGEKITFPETDFWNIAEPIILVVYMLVYMAFLSLLAIFSKSHDLKYMYYPAFATCLTSVISAILHWHIEDSLWLLVMPLSNQFGSPIRAMAKAIEKATTYYVTIEEYGYGSYEIEETYIWEYPALIIFLAITLVSVVTYQLYTENAEQDLRKARWRLTGTARTASIAIISVYGIYSLLVLIPNFFENSIVFGYIYYFLALLSILCTISMLTFALPIVLIPYLLITASKQAVQSRNPRQIFNPLVLLAIFLTVVGTWAIYNTTMQCF